MIVEKGRKEREGSRRAWATWSKGVRDGREAVDKEMQEMKQWRWAWVRTKMGEEMCWDQEAETAEAEDGGGEEVGEGMVADDVSKWVALLSEKYFQAKLKSG